MSAFAAMRLVVVGASAGIGRALVELAAAEGARVEAWARRVDAPVTRAVDVRDTAAVERAMASAVGALGGMDALVYAAGIAPLAQLAQADDEVWRDALETNLLGAARVARAALPHLGASAGRAFFLSSDSVGDPREGLAIYAATKAALEQLVLGLRREHPEVRWTTVVVGPTATDIAARWSRTLVRELWPRWKARGLDAKAAAEPEVVARRILMALADPVDRARVIVHD